MLWHLKVPIQGSRFYVQKCSSFTSNTYTHKETTLDGDAIQVTKFSYLRDNFSSGRGGQGAVTARIRSG